MAERSDQMPRPSFLGLPGIALGGTPDHRTRRFVAIAPGEEAPLVHLDLPVRVTGPARLGIARRQLVDRLGQGAAELELHPLVLGKEPWTRSILVAPDVAAGWRADPLVLDRRCRGLVPDYLSLPAAEDAVVIAEEAGHVRARIGSEDGFSAPTALAASLLSAALQEESPKVALLIGEVPAEVRAVLAAAGVPITADPADVNFSLAAVAGVENVDLRRDPGRAADRFARQLIAWSFPVLLALAALGVASVDRMRDIRTLRAETASVRAATVDLLRRGLIPSAPILDIRAQVVQRVDGLGARDTGPDALDALHDAAEVIAPASVDLRSVTMTPTDILLTLRAVDFGEVDALVDALRAAGLRAAADRARTTGEGQVEAEIDISLGAAEP